MTFAPFFIPSGKAPRTDLAALGIDMRTLLTGAHTNGQVALFEETTAPGKGPPLHVHHRQTEIFRFLEGTYEIALGDQRVVAEAGACAVVPPGLRHAFRNVGATPARLQFLLTPALDAEAFFAALADAATHGTPDPAVLAQLADRFGTEIVGPPLG